MTVKHKRVPLTDEQVAVQDALIQQADTSHLNYEIQDAATEIELLHGVGFNTVKENENYHLFQRGDEYALLVGGFVIQGFIGQVYNTFAGLENTCSGLPELYNYLLELVRAEGL